MSSAISKLIKKTEHVMCYELNNETSAINLVFCAFIIALFSLISFVSLNLVAFSAALFALFVLYKKNTAPLEFKNYFPLGLMFAFCISAAISSYALSSSTHHGYNWLLLWLSCFFAGFVFSKTNPKHNYFFITPALVILIIHFLVSMLAYHLGFDDTVFNAEFPHRLNLGVLPPFRVAVFAGFCALYAVNLVLFLKNRTAKIFYFFCFLISFLMLILAYHKNPIYIFSFTLMLALMLMPGFKKIKLLIFSSFLIAAIVFVFSTSEKQRSFLFVAMKDPLQHNTIQTRMALWEIGKELFIESPYFGYGLKSYAELHPKYVKTHKAELDKKYPLYEKAMRQPHNFILGRLVETGLVGGTLFLILLIITAIYAFKAPPEQRWLACFFIFYFLIGIIDDPLVRTNDAFIFILMGLVIGRPQAKIANSLSCKHLIV